MVELQAHLEELEELGAEVIALSADDSDSLREFVESEELEYTILVDRGGEVIERYGIRNPEHPEGAGIVPHPTTLVVDREGRIRFKRVDVDYSVRPPAEELLQAVRSLDEAD